MKSILTLALLLIVIALPAQVYVDIDATGAADGSSWADAYTDLDSALALTSPQDIWVAEGRYAPGPKDSTIQFELKAAHRIYGGFTGTEASLDERDVDSHVTILDGDSNEDDITGDYSANKSDNATHVIYIASGYDDCRLDGITVMGGAASLDDASNFSERGGGIYSLSRMTVDACIFQENQARSGGAIYIQEGHGSVIYGTQFISNVSSSQAAGVMLNDVLEPVVRSCFFNNNITSRGSLYTRYCLDAVIDSCLFTNNQPHPDNTFGPVGYFNWNSTGILLTNSSFVDMSSVNATAIYNDGSELSGLPSAQVDNCIFSNINTSGFGGAAYFWQSTYEMNGCSFVSGNSLNTAGGLYNGASEFLVSNTSFSRNAANFGAATASYNNSRGTFMNCNFEGNTAGTSGGASITGFGAQVTFEDCIFEDNEASFGGALYVQNQETAVTINKSNFIANTAARSGGAVNLSCDCPGEFTEVLFEANSADFGGAISCVSDTLGLASLSLTRSRFNFNFAQTQGGAINLGNVNADVTSSLFSNNQVDNDMGAGAAISQNSIASSGNSSSVLDITHCTFAFNLSNVGAALGQFEEDSSECKATIANSILYNPGFEDYAVEQGDVEALSLGGNLVGTATDTDIFTEENDTVGEDPEFTNASNDEYDLQLSSPAIDQGIQLLAHDIDIDGNPIIGPVDKGAFESPFGVGASSLEQLKGLTILENPTTEFIRFQLKNELAGDLLIVMRAMNGKILDRVELYKPSGSQIYTMPELHGFTGSLILSVRLGDKQSSAIVVVH